MSTVQSADAYGTCVHRVRYSVHGVYGTAYNVYGTVCTVWAYSMCVIFGMIRTVCAVQCMQCAPCVLHGAYCLKTLVTEDACIGFSRRGMVCCVLRAVCMLLFSFSASWNNGAYQRNSVF